MSDFLTEARGWTPVIDALVEELGLIPAAVYGAVWRFCQLEDGVCRASLETIADRVGVDRRTVLRHVKALCEAGYLRDLTPDERARPHRYADTGRAKIAGIVEARTRRAQAAARREPERSDRESHLEQGGGEGVTESHTGSDRESLPGVTQSHSRSDRESLPGVTESHPKRVLKRESKKSVEETPKDTHTAAGAAAPGEGAPPGDGDVDERTTLNALSERFCRLTGLGPPSGGRELDTRWRRPLREMADLAGWDEARAEELIAKAVTKLRSGGCVIADPRSILRTYRAMAGEVRRRQDRRRYTGGRYGGLVRH